LAERIIYSIIVLRLKNKKPAVVFMSGDSGEGKSYSGLTLQHIILKTQGLNLIDFMNDVNVYTPLEYPQKIDALLGYRGKPSERKRLKKVNVIAIHEARELVKAKMWYSFLNQAIGDINAMSRSIKRLCIIITSQFIRDISTDIRYTLNYYIKCSRPMGNSRARLLIYKLYKDDSDLEKPKLKKLRLKGTIVFPDGTTRKYSPAYLELTRPPYEITRLFEDRDREAKIHIIRRKIDKLIQTLKLELETQNPKVEAMAEFYSKNPSALANIGKRKNERFILSAEARKAHDLNDSEFKDFQKLLNEKIKKRGFTTSDDDIINDDINE
jgi:hypothetical protein